MDKRALIVRGGWEGHDPVGVSKAFGEILGEEGFQVEISDTLDAFSQREALRSTSLIIPHWTMGAITKEQLEPVLDAVARGAGLAGVHGGMCDAFHDSVDWHFMTGGQWVAHPGGQSVRFTVELKKGSSEIVEGIDDFSVTSEQYYLHVDPAVKVLGTTRFPAGKGPFVTEGSAVLDASGFGNWNFEAHTAADGPHVTNDAVDMPVIWTKRFGRGRVFYCSVGHNALEVRTEPLRTIIKRGFLWASRKN
jgi:uncharacterized protein